MNVWSEKTTVCRIFSCKRALKLPANSFQLPAVLRVRLRPDGLRRDQLHSNGSASILRPPELSILRFLPARCKPKRLLPHFRLELLQTAAAARDPEARWGHGAATEQQMPEAFAN
jgi:hypothetical protein